ncbi:MAG TPA: 7TM diverse intracellular signaling domain-containing protein [Oligoflexus sp.]|uniref:7TM diverse intracellular signaling domain-containing protein n=1 Tax=Oligoflexus sp. TaxID=1971216 RepID=UPI002D67AD51|nr:7TM diverse intracellular signaling domain-containing protein [Oligoflexus sp.]HYX37176.1 7TM diverse intracellular signaling domain-containing protein [Oligoflexus sp.]
MMRFLFVLVVWALLGSPCPGQSLVAVQGSDRIEIWKEAVYFRDDAKTLTIQSLLANPEALQFQPSKGFPVIGFYNGAVWAKLRLRNGSQEDTQRMLQLGCGIFSKIEVFEIIDQKVVAYHKGGLQYPAYPNYDVHNRLPTFSLNLPAGTNKDVIIRMESRYSTEASMNLYTLERLNEEEDVSGTLFGVYSGIILVMVVYNFIIFLNLKDLTYLYYCCAILVTHLGALVGSFGFLHSHLGIHAGAYSEQLLTIAQALAVGSTFKFFQSFVNARATVPRLYRICDGIVLGSLALALLPLFVFNIQISALATLAIQAGQPFIVGTTLYLMWRGNREAKSYFIAWSVFLSTAFIYVLQVEGFIPVNAFTKYSALVGGCFEVVLLSLALGDRINSMRKDKYLAQRELLEIQKDRNLKLESMVTEKTASLTSTNHELQLILDNVPLGIVSVLRDGRLHPSASVAARQFFPDKPFDQIDLQSDFLARVQLNSDLKSRLLETLAISLNADLPNYEVNSHMLPAEVMFATNSGQMLHVKTLWRPILGSDASIDRIMLCLIDVTELRKLQSLARSDRASSAIFNEILKSNGQESQTVLDACSWLHKMPQIPGDLDRMPENIIAAKDLANRLEFHSLSQALDQFQKAIGMGPLAVQPAVQQVLRVIKDYERQLLLLRHFSLDVTHAASDTKNGSEGQPAVFKLNNFILDLLPVLSRTAQSIGKPTPLIKISCQEVELPSAWYQNLMDSFIHMITNSMDHGVEWPDERQALGKSSVGRIDILARVSSSGFHLTYQDDGRGVDPDLFRKKRPGTTKSDEDLVRDLLFEDGFSTKDQATKFSGRGYGLAAVKSSLESKGINIDITLEPAQPGSRRRSLQFVLFAPALSMQRNSA